MLLISVIRTPVDPDTGISLNVKLPEGSHAEIVTGVGSISIRGTPASASLKSVSGDIRAELSEPINADIRASDNEWHYQVRAGSTLKWRWSCFTDPLRCGRLRSQDRHR